MRVLAWALVVSVMAACTSRPPGPPPAPGVSRDLALARAARTSDVRYDLRLRIPKLAEAPIDGRLTIHAMLRDTGEPLIIDFETSRDHVHALDVNGTPAAFEYLNGHIVVPADALRDGSNDITVTFTAGDASLNRGDDFLYALFVPARARQAIPCFDQPDIKARWTLTLDIPADTGIQAVSNGREVGRGPAPPSPADAEAPGHSFTEVRFAETEPLPTYLFSFLVGDFQVETATRNGRTFRMFHRETDAAKVAANRDAIFDLHARALAYMEEYTGLAYPFGKFDFALIPAFQFGGMEHAGLVYYNASGLMLDESATQNQRLGRASTIAHETAHMWFGDLVTMRWFDDVWMKEVFANFMAAKIVNPSFPDVNHELRFLLAHYPEAYSVDRTAGANPIRQPLDNLVDAGSLYGAIIYQKAPIVMRHLESLVGEIPFRDGLRTYLSDYAFGNATWLDLIAILDELTPVDLQGWSRSWVEEPGRPTITTELEVADGRIRRLAFRQEDPAGRDRRWPEELRVTLGNDTGSREARVLLSGEVVEVPDAAGTPAPRYVLPNGSGWAYGDFVLDAGSLAYLTSALPRIEDPLTRGAAWVTLWDAMLDRTVTPATFVDTALAALPRETDEQMTARILGYLTDAWWRFLEPGDRASRVAAVERMLRQGLDKTPTTSRKAAWFRALTDVAQTPYTIAWLRRVWERTERIPGLPLAETDEIALAEDLAVREVPGWDTILSTQLARTENPDRKARLEFVMPALSADPRVRDTWFASLADVENRRREPWVLEGLRYMHHPLRAQASAKHIPKTLAMLQEIQQTGDIFFPKRWLDSTLGGHRSPEAAHMVQTFLDGLPSTYPPRLRAITLQSADELFRAAGDTQ